MTVKELIEQLQKLDQNKQVGREYDDHGVAMYEEYYTEFLSMKKKKDMLFYERA